MRAAILDTINLIWTIAIRELVSMFRVPAGWIIVALFAFLSAVLFVNQTLVPGEPGSMRYFFTASAWLLIPIAPAISMRLMAEEYRTGSFESLRTTPAGDWAVAIGKYIGSVLFLIIMLAPSLIYPIVLTIVSNPAPDPGPIVAGYLMLMLVGSLYLAIGLLASSTTSSQTLAFLGTMMALVLFMVLTSILAPRAGSRLAPILNELSVIARAAELGKGVIDSATIFFFIIGSLWMVALTAGVLESRRLARSRWSLAIMGILFVSATATAAIFAGVLTSTHHVRIDVTSTNAHKLSPRAISMVNSLPDETRIVLAINQTETDRVALDLVTDVLETYDRASDLLTAQIIDLSTTDGLNQINLLDTILRERESGEIAENQQTIAQLRTTLASASELLTSASPQLASIGNAIDASTPSGATNRAFFDQRATLVRLGARDLLAISDSIGSDPGNETLGLINTQLAQLEDLRDQLKQFANAREIAPAARASSKTLVSSLDTIIDQLAIASDRLSRLHSIDADSVQAALSSGEVLLIIGPPEIGVAAVDIDTLIPPTQVLLDAGISPAGVIGPRAQQLIATALGQLVIQSHPIVVFVHAGNPGELLGPQSLLSQAVSRFKTQGIDAVEWAPLHQTDQPSLASIDPLGQRPVVYITLATDSARGGGDSGITGARRATALAETTDRLLKSGESVLVCMNPSVFGSFGETDPLVKALDPFGIIPDPNRTLLTLRMQSSKRIADPATLVVPSTQSFVPYSQFDETSAEGLSIAQIHPLAQAVNGLRAVYPWTVPMTIDRRVDVFTAEVISIPGSQDLWAERDWLDLWSTDAPSRQYLNPQPMFDDAEDLRRDGWLIAAAAQRSIGNDFQRVLAVGSNSWIYDAVTFSQGQLVDGRITTQFPGNLALLESSIAWLAGLDDLIQPGIQSRPIATIKPMDADQLSLYRWILLAGMPGLILVLGIATRLVFG
ncbi:MAG: hypothetical protein JJ974_02685 [Phycisphaerales bacterium]|nr:hypothetical protein [Phycisphaerales bacterium]